MATFLSNDENNSNFVKIDGTSTLAANGTTVASAPTDYGGTSFSSPPSIGAFEVAGPAATVVDESGHDWFTREAQTNPLRISRW